LMPLMTGLQLATELHQIKPELPIILMTGHGDTLTPQQVEAAGVCQLLRKPTPIQEFGAAVRAALGHPAKHQS
jgi:FixJ family two-component response regulator